MREKILPDFSRDLENLSPNLSPTRREALNFSPSLVGKGAGGLGFPDDVKSQKILQTIIEALQPQDFVLALWQGGSAAHGYTDEWSDLDIEVIVEDNYRHFS